MYGVLDNLKVHVHPKKRFIGPTRKGFDFLGYWLEPDKPLTPSPVSLSRLIERSHQLHEQTADLYQLRDYVCRWHQWYHGGLRGLTARTSSFIWAWQYVTKALRLNLAPEIIR
jgi:hypothetical protein